MPLKKINNKVLKLKDSKFIIKNKIATLAFNRNDIRNALTGSWLIEDLVSTVDFVNNNKNISILIITGNGNAFSSGGNIKEMLKKNRTPEIQKISGREIQNIGSHNFAKIIARSNAQAKTRNHQKWN